MRRYCFLSLCFAITCVLGCWNQSAETTVRQLDRQTGPFAGTIASVCELTGYAGVRIEGVSLVYGLAGTGSSESPPSIRKYLTNSLRKVDDAERMGREYEGLTAEQIIDSRNTAVVQVSGLIPAGSPKGSPFDIELSALAATQTTSLQGGRLLDAELQIVVPGRQGRWVRGRPTAIAAGAVFINPFTLSKRKGTKADPRKGVVLGGGRSILDRRIELTIVRPDYRLARQIQQRINTRFAQKDGSKVADATRQRVKINVPEEYRNDHNHFVSLLMSLYLRDSRPFEELKLKELDSFARQGGTDYEQISLAWEGIGRGSLEFLEPLYSDFDGEAAFYAARTAVNLGDRKAIDTLIKIAHDQDHPRRIEAVESLGGICRRDLPARAALDEMLDDENDMLRLRAYEAIRRVGSEKIRAQRLPGGLRLESVQSCQKNLLAVTSTLESRIVIMGPTLRCNENIFYETQDGTVMINAQPGDSQIQITRRMPSSRGYISAKCGFLLSDLVYTLAMPIDSQDDQYRPGCGLTFSQIAGILHDICLIDKMVPAQFVLHRPKGQNWFVD